MRVREKMRIRGWRKLEDKIRMEREREREKSREERMKRIYEVCPFFLLNVIFSWDNRRKPIVVILQVRGAHILTHKAHAARAHVLLVQLAGGSAHACCGLAQARAVKRSELE